MDLRSPHPRSKYHSFAVSVVCGCGWLCGMALSPMSVTGQITQPADRDAKLPESDPQLQAHCRSALVQLHEGNLPQALKILEVPGETALPISLVGDDLLGSACGGLNRVLGQLQPDEQFDLLEQWSILTGSQKKIRLLTALVPTVAPPAEFARVLGERPRPTSFPVASIGNVRGIFCSGWALAIAARDSGRLKRLMNQLRPHVDRKIPNAERLFALALIADGSGDLSMVADQLTELTNRIKGAASPADARPTIEAADIVIALAASRHPSLRSLARNFLEATLNGMTDESISRQRPSVPVRPFLRQALTSLILSDRDDTAVEPLENRSMKYWLPVSSHVGSRCVWQRVEDHVAHLSGSENDALIFRYPLEGDFEFHCDVPGDGRNTTDAGLIFGGTQYQTNSDSNEFFVQEVGGFEIGRRACPFTNRAEHPVFNRLSVVSTSSNVTILVNRHPFWTGQSHGWLELCCLNGNRSLFRHLKLAGKPTIPRAVRMADADWLRHWQSGNRKWTSINGVIHAPERPANAPNDDVEDHLSYRRPLLANETVDYEFLYQSDVSELAPTLGRVVFRLRPDGVRLHWLTESPTDWTGLGIDNAVSEPLNRRGPKPLPLKQNDWNQVSVSRTEQLITLSLNGTVVYQQPIDRFADHRFGLYRDRNAARAMVRNIVLTGDWPKTLPQEFLDDPLVSDDPPFSVADRHSLRQLFPDELLADNALVVRRQAMTMPVARRFEFLSERILPGPDHAGIRFTGDFAATRPSPPAVEPGLVEPALGGQIVSPIFAWIDAARELGRLADCRRQVEAVATTDEFQQRAKISLLLLIDLEHRPPEANDATWESLFEMLKHPSSTDGENHWPEMLLAVRSAERFPDNPICYDLISDFVLKRMLQWKRPDITRWHNHLASLYGPLLLRRKFGAMAAAPTLTDLGEWVPVVAGNADTFGSGFPNLQWSRCDNQVVKTCSHNADFLYYRVPLGGDFQIEADLVQSGMDPVAIMVAGTYVGPLGAMNGLDHGSFHSSANPILFQPSLTNVGKAIHYRAVVQAGTRTIYLNGRQVHSAPLSSSFDPWIAIRSPGRHQSSVSDLRILGKPTVLDVVPLSASSDLTGWLSYHEEGRWEISDQPDSKGVIVGHSNPALSGTLAESLLRYQRPLIEDGSIEYEFFYQPGVAEAHPALDRLALMLGSSGIQEHWITDGRHDRTGLAPGNLTDVRANKRGPAEFPLKAGKWNRLRLSLRGATARIELNQILVYERLLEPENQRAFGLFHYADRTQAQVRNVVMQGDWPKVVPAVSQQTLAGKTSDWLDRDIPRLKSVFQCDFAKEGLSERYFEFPSLNGITATPDGVLVVESTTKNPIVWDICARYTVSGDFDVEATFAQLQIDNRTQHCGILLRAILDEPERPVFDIHRNVDHLNQQIAHVSRWIAEPVLPGRHLAEGESVACEASAGRLRLARRGKKIHYLFAENDSTNFQLLGTKEISLAPTMSNGIRMECYDFGANIKVVWKKLILRAERMTWHPGPLKNNIATLKVVQADGRGIRTVFVPSSAGFRYVGSPEWSADGRKIAMDVSDGTHASHIAVIDSDGANFKDLGPGCMPSFSKDGSRIAFSHNGIMTMKSDGTDRRIVDSGGWGTQWSPDGKWIAYAKNQNVTLWNVATRETRQLLSGSAANRYQRIYWNLAWSHDSRSIAFRAERNSGGAELAVADVDSPDGFKVLLFNASEAHPDVTFSPDNKRVISSINDRAGSGQRLHAILRQEPELPVLLDVIPPGQTVDGVAWSRDGKSIVIVALEASQPTEWTTDQNSEPVLE